MAPQNDPKTNKKQHEKNQKKERKKEPTWSVKPDPAVNGKRCMQTLFVTQKRLGMFFSFYFTKRYLFENASYWPFLASLGLLLAQFCALLGRFWPHLAALGRPRGDTHAHFQTPEDTYTHTRNDIQK